MIPSVLPRVLLCAGFGLFISGLHSLGYPVSWPVLSSIVPSLVLGLLLVFRTNTAYDRFWEGRKLWGQMVNTARNLARQIWVTVAVRGERDRATKQQALYLLVAFAFATKQRLRNQPLNHELRKFVTPDQYDHLQQMNNPPLQIAFWLSDYLQMQTHQNGLNPYQLQSMIDLLNSMVNALGGCERILRTPLPLAYSIHLKQLLMIYCLALPFQVVREIGWWTAPIVGLVSFTVFGIEEIGLEIENPFDCDPNDLPLDELCRTMQNNIEDLMTLPPSIEQ